MTAQKESIVAPIGTESVAVQSERGAWLSLVLGVGISGLALLLIARSVNFALSLQALLTSQLWWVALAFIVQLGAMALVVKRWQVLLRPCTTQYVPLLQIYYISHLVNTLLPIKLGTVARVLLASESEELNIGFVVGSVAIEKVLDTLGVLVLLLLFAPFAPLPLLIRESVTASALIILLAVFAIIGIRRFREQIMDFSVRAEKRLGGQASPAIESLRLASLLRGILQSVLNLTRRQELVVVLFWTTMVWLAGIMVNQLLLNALNISLDWTAPWLVFIVLMVGTRVPALPANIGVFHYLVILALGVYGVNQNAALAYAILLHLVVFIFPAILGAVCALPVSARLTRLVAHGLRR